MCNNATNSSCAPSVDEVKDRGSPNCESQYTVQSLLVTRREVQFTPTVLFYQATGCDPAGFTFARSMGVRGDQKVALLDDICEKRLGNSFREL